MIAEGLRAVTWGFGWLQQIKPCHVVAIIENGNLPHLLLATACKRLRIAKNGGHPLNPPLNSTQDRHLGCIWFVEMKKMWSARAWAILMEQQFFWQKSIGENPELLTTFFAVSCDSVFSPCDVATCPPQANCTMFWGPKPLFDCKCPLLATPDHGLSPTLG